MKKITILILAISLVFTLTACKTTLNESPENTTNPIQETTSGLNTPVVQQPMYSVSLPVVAEPEKTDDGTILFHYIYQNISLIGPDPEVADRVIIDFLNKIDKTVTTAESIKAAAKQTYAPGANWNPYLCQITYKPTRIDQSVMSLFGKYITYSGTPHPESSYTSVTYDLINGEALMLSDILTDDATGDTLSSAIIGHLSTQKETAYLYEGFEQTVKDRFNKSYDHDHAWNLSQNGLQFYFAPYEIAPYSSGVVVAEIPYAELTGILKDEYFPAERENATGTVFAESFDENKLQRFTQFSEVVLTGNSRKVLLYTDKSVYNINLYKGSWSANGATFIPEYEVFSASSLTPGDAIMIEDNFNDSIPEILLSYESNGRTVEQYISFNRENGTVTLTEN